MGAFFYIKWFLLIALMATILSAFYLMSSQGEKTANKYSVVNPKFESIVNQLLPPSNRSALSVPQKAMNKVIAQKPPFAEDTLTIPLSEKGKPPSIHIFYYPWYGNPKHDNGKYYHWNHVYLPHWNDEIAKKYPQGQHEPPPDIGASFYPKLGPYSSRDPEVIEQHMKWISSSGVDVVVVSWYPPGVADDQGQSWDDLIPALLNASEKYRLKLTFHMEPYKGRNATTIHRDIVYITKTYGTHPALYRRLRSTDSKINVMKEGRPLLYFYDSYLVSTEQWKMLTTKSGKLSVRGTAYDVIFIGLLVKAEDKFILSESGFDGIYTYFASEGFSYGSTPANWPSITTYCRKNKMLFVPSVGPGYDDIRVRPWNGQNTKNRNDGEYYSRMFKMAHTARPDILSITSFNEWHEGTQIEPAMPFHDNQTNYTYQQYPKGPEQYLHLTLDLIKKYFMPAHQIAPAKIANIV